MAFSENFWDWSATSGLNGPAGSDNIGTNLDDVLRGIQGGVVRGLSSKGADIASATTPALGAVEGLLHDITGTNTITGFGTVRHGILKILKYEGAQTLTNSATLILMGGANRTVADGDVSIFFSEGSGTWREIDFARASISPHADASATVKGVVELATDAETLTGTDTARAITPANVKSVLGAVKLTSGTVSAAATLDVVMTSYTGYKNKLFVFESFIPATTNASLYLRTSTDGGSNYAGSAGNYRYAGFRVPESGTVTGNGSAGATQIDLNFGSTVVNTAAFGMSGMVMLYDTTNTAMRPRIEARSASNNSSEGWTLTAGVGSRESAEDTDAFRILFSAGNIASGTWTLYGWN